MSRCQHGGGAFDVARWCEGELWEEEDCLTDALPESAEGSLEGSTLGASLLAALEVCQEHHYRISCEMHRHVEHVLGKPSKQRSVPPTAPHLLMSQDRGKCPRVRVSNQAPLLIPPASRHRRPRMPVREVLCPRAQRVPPTGRPRLSSGCHESNFTTPSRPPGPSVHPVDLPAPPPPPDPPELQDFREPPQPSEQPVPPAQTGVCPSPTSKEDLATAEFKPGLVLLEAHEAPVTLAELRAAARWMPRCAPKSSKNFENEAHATTPKTGRWRRAKVAKMGDSPSREATQKSLADCATQTADQCQEEVEMELPLVGLEFQRKRMRLVMQRQEERTRAASSASAARSVCGTLQEDGVCAMGIQISVVPWGESGCSGAAPSPSLSDAYQERGLPRDLPAPSFAEETSPKKLGSEKACSEAEREAYMEERGEHSLRILRLHGPHLGKHASSSLPKLDLPLLQVPTSEASFNVPMGSLRSNLTGEELEKDCEEGKGGYRKEKTDLQDIISEVLDMF